MSKNVHSFCMVVLLAVLASSCIKETLPECPSEMIVKLVIKDMNYSNIAHFPELSPESTSQPFSHFSGSLYYILTDAATKQTVRESEIMVLNDNNPDYTITFNDLPAGKYELSVWGNVTNAIPIGILHQNGLEHTDIYTAQATLSIIPDSQTQTVELVRAKGKLVVFCRNFPSNISVLSLAIAPVYQSVDATLNYQGSTNIQKSTTLQAINETFVAPTPQGSTTKLDLSFYTTDSRATMPVLKVPQMDIAMHRNEISAVAIDYDETGGAWEIWSYTEGEWTKVHHLDIE